MTEGLQAAQKAASPFSIWWAMVEAQQELLKQPIPDKEIVLHFVGSGASTSVTAGQIRKMLDAIYLCKDGKSPPGDDCEICHGSKGGVHGNENVIDGKVVCDYCHADGSYKVSDAKP